MLPSKTVERAYPQYSPDGKELAFIEDRNRLMVLDLKTQKVRQVTTVLHGTIQEADSITNGRPMASGLRLSLSAIVMIPIRISVLSVRREVLSLI